MRQLFLGLVLSSILVMGCKEEVDTNFLITQNSVGKLDKISLVRDLDIIFEQDSVINDTTVINLINNAKKVKVFEKKGKHLLTLTPSSDSIPTIENVKIEDPRFITKKGVGLNSTFKDIKDNYAIRKVLTSMNNVVVLLKDSDLYFTIDKKELPTSLRYASSKNIEAVQIPDEAKIKYMMVGWE